MPSAATASTISVLNTVHLLDGPFSGFANGVAEDRYAFWLGSGISFGRVDGLKKVVPRIIEFLRVRITGDPACRFKKALITVLQLASLSPDESARSDFSKPFHAWPDAQAITDRLIGRYAHVLNTEVDEEAEDFLLWNGVDVVSTFAQPSLDPDVEHICIAILILEGVASEIVSANWDGLIENAVAALAGGQPALAVCVRSEDLRNPVLKAHIYKIHGCAVKARDDEATFRPYLVARQPQILSWRSRQENKALVDHVVHLATVKPTLMMGLSAQDPNIQSVFAEAESTLNWPWPGERPSYLFSNEQLGIDHKTLLQNVYRGTYNASNRDQIAESALIGTYAKPLLVALVLHVVCAKLGTLIELAPATFTDPDRMQLHKGLSIIRDMVANVASAETPTFIQGFIEQSGRAIALFRNGTHTLRHIYHSITSTPIQQIALDTGLQASGLTEVAVAAAILGLGVDAGHWVLSAEDITAPDAAVITLSGMASSARIFFVLNSHVAMCLQHNGHVTDIEHTILIHSKEKVRPMPRSSGTAIGRTGKAELREVSISSLLSDVTTVDELMQRFRDEIAI